MYHIINKIDEEVTIFIFQLISQLKKFLLYLFEYLVNNRLRIGRNIRAPIPCRMFAQTFSYSFLQMGPNLRPKI